MAEATEIDAEDALSGWPAPEAETEWLGPAAAEMALREAHAAGRLHHAWLIGGPRGVGKATLAFRFARFVLAYPDPAAIPPGATLTVPPDHRAFRQTAARSHPNLLVLRKPWDEKLKRYKTALTVDEVRRIQTFFGTTPGEAGWRIAIVDAADDLNPNAANALLKMLEEPPKRGLFLLVSHAPGRLLPTIRSRTRRLDLPPLPAETITTALAARGTGADDGARQLAADLADGSLRRAILLAEGEGLDLYRGFRSIVDRLPSVDFSAVHALADGIAARSRTDAFEAFADAVRGWLARRVRRAPEPVAAGEGAALAAVPPARWADIWERFAQQVSDSGEYNLERRQVVLRLFEALQDAAR